MTDAHSDAPFLFGCDLPLAKTDRMMFHTISHGVAGTRMVAFGGRDPRRRHLAHRRVPEDQFAVQSGGIADSRP